MSSRETGDQPDPAAELLGRWQAHHAESSEPGASEEPEAPSAPKHAARPPVDRTRRPARAFDQTEAGREVVEALGLIQPQAGVHREPEPEPVAEQVSPPVAEPTPSAPPGGSRTAAPTLGETTDVVFAPRMLVRRLLGLLLLVLLVASAGASYLAYDDPKTGTVGLAATLVVVTLVLYAVRVGSTPTRLAIRSGQLEVVRGNQREIFDLTSRYTRIQVVGTPGRPGWKVLFGRFGRDPLVVDSSMVDARQFTSALERARPS